MKIIQTMKLISQNHVFNQTGRMESHPLGPKLNILQSLLAAHDDHIEQTAKFFSKTKNSNKPQSYTIPSYSRTVSQTSYQNTLEIMLQD